MDEGVELDRDLVRGFAELGQGKPRKDDVSSGVLCTLDGIQEQRPAVVPHARQLEAVAYQRRIEGGKTICTGQPTWSMRLEGHSDNDNSN